MGDLAQNMWWLSSLQGVPLDVFGANFCTISPGLWGTPHPRGRNGHRMQIRDTSSLSLPSFCARFLSLCSLPTQSSCWYLEAPGSCRMRGGVMEVVWGKRRELMTNSSLQGGIYLVKSYFF